jgi:hypothetical protein
MPRVRVPRHIARLVAWLVVDYFAYTVRLALARLVAQLVVNYFAYTVRPGASTPRTANSSITSPMMCVRVPRLVAWLVIDYFAYAARPGASAHHACDAPGFYLASLVLMAESAESNRLTLVKPRSTWVITSKTSPMNPSEPLD